MSHRNPHGGTLMIERTFDGMRFSKASGTNDPKLRDEIDGMLTKMWQDPKARDTVRLLRVDRKLRLLDVYDRFLRYGLTGIYDVHQAQRLQPALDAWLPDLDVVRETREAYRGMLRRLLVRHPRVTVDDVPAVLKRVKGKMPAPAFNRTRAALLAFLRDTVGREHDLWRATSAVGTKTEHRKPGKPQPVERARAIAVGLGRMGPQWWTLCCTGLRPKSEYLDRPDCWTVRGDRLEVRGEKTAGSVRVVPLICVPVRPVVGYQAFRKALRGFDVTPRDARRTFAHWCELAGIPRSRRLRYEGHAIRDVHGLYEDHSPEYYLPEDRQRLLGVVGETVLMAVVP